MAFSFDDATHTYTLDGEVLPSVTHIIRFLSADTDKSRPWLRDAAAERGTAIHNACAMFDFGEPDISLPCEYSPYFEAYKAFIRDYAPTWERIEYPMYARKNGFCYAGTLDRLGTINGRTAILDIKTGTAGKPAQYIAQLTAYRELYGNDADLYILLLSKDGTYKLKKYDPDLGLLDACITLHKSLLPKRRNK